MSLNSVFTDEEFVGDFAVAHALRHQFEDLELWEEGAQVLHCRRGESAQWACLVQSYATAWFSLTRRVALGSGTPTAHRAHAADAVVAAPDTAPRARPRPGAASSTLPGQHPDCLTTYVSVSPDDRLLYVACFQSHQVQVRDAGSLELVRRLPAGDGAYNVEPSPDGRWLLVTNKKAQSVSVFDARTWREIARVPTSKKLPHGIAFSPDGRWAFVSVESVGTDPGAVDAIDLTTRTRVASMEVPRQPTGIAVWRGR